MRIEKEKGNRNSSEFVVMLDFNGAVVCVNRNSLKDLLMYAEEDQLRKIQELNEENDEIKGDVNEATSLEENEDNEVEEEAMNEDIKPLSNTGNATSRGI